MAALPLHADNLEHLPEADRKHLSAVALKAFFRITDAWALGDEDRRVLLGSPARSTYYRWKKGDAPAVGVDTLERISYLLGIYKALHILFPDPHQADGWLLRPNTLPPFEGASPLAYLRGGRMLHLAQVRQFLDAWRG